MDVESAARLEWSSFLRWEKLGKKAGTEGGKAAQILAIMFNFLSK